MDQRITFIKDIIPYGTFIFNDDSKLKKMFYSDKLIKSKEFDDICNCVYGYIETEDSLLVVLFNKSNSVEFRFRKKYQNSFKKIYFMLLNDYYATITFNLPIGGFNNNEDLPVYIKGIYFMFNHIYIFFEEDIDVRNIDLRRNARDYIYSKLINYPHFNNIIDFDTRLIFDSMENINKNYAGSTFNYFR